ncbi:uncharacterized protein [Nicotiana tomentosiformis]|uniref:uncharacterized protein n=1 Tax=Nicotiana tomentosiformis TaxID=4098 RepID=UPI00388CABE9
MKREKLDKYFGRFPEMLRQLYVNIPFTEVLTQMPVYAKFLKEILSSKRKLEETIVVKVNSHCSAILQNKIPQKCGDLGRFTIPCSLGSEIFDKALCDSGAFINLMPLSLFRKLEGELGVIKSIPVSLQLADQTTILSEEIIEDVLVRVDKFFFPVYFIVVDMEVNKEVPVILGRPFLCTDRAILDIYEGQLMLRVGNKKVVFQIKRMMKYPSDEGEVYYQSSTVEDEDPEIKKEEEALETEDQVHERKLVELLKKHRKAMGWSIADTQGISPAICIHKILLEENSKPMVQSQRKMNKYLEEVDAGVIFPISDSQWIGPV